AERLERPAFDLSGAEGLVDGAPHLADRGHLDGAHRQRVGVDLHLDHVGAPGIGGIGGAAIGRLVEALPFRRLVAQGDLRVPALLPEAGSRLPEALDPAFRSFDPTLADGLASTPA